MKYFLLYLTCGLWGCTALNQESPASFPDFLPPVLEDWREGPTGLEFRFNEYLSSLTWRMEGQQVSDYSGQVEGSSGKISLPEGLNPGLPVRLLLEAKDRWGNSNTFLRTYWVPNPRLPRLQITEALINGARTRPDMVELLALDSGNLAGGEIRDGIPGESCQGMVFPPVEVSAGDRILIHFKSQGTGDETAETQSKSQTQTTGTSDKAWDFWIPEGEGLVGTSGVILVFEKPGGTCKDALAYSNRASDPEDRYGGFGSRKMQAAMEWCLAQGAWHGSSSPLRPEDCVPSGATTATRTLSRSEGAETDGPSDWFTSAQSSLGEKNLGVAYAGRRR